MSNEIRIVVEGGQGHSHGDLPGGPGLRCVLHGMKLPAGVAAERSRIPVRQGKQPLSLNRDNDMQAGVTFITD